MLEILQSFGISWRKNCPYRDCRQLSSISVIEFQMDDCGSSTILHAHCIYNVSGCCSLLNDIVLFVRTGTYVMNAISFRMFRSLRSKWPNMQIESTKVSISIQMKECLTFCNWMNDSFILKIRSLSTLNALNGCIYHDAYQQKYQLRISLSLSLHQHTYSHCWNQIEHDSNK